MSLYATCKYVDNSKIAKVNRIENQVHQKVFASSCKMFHFIPQTEISPDMYFTARLLLNGNGYFSEGAALLWYLMLAKAILSLSFPPWLAGWQAGSAE